MRVSASKSKDIYIRRYSKIQDIFAQMGGLIKGLILVVNFAYLPFARNEFLVLEDARIALLFSDNNLLPTNKLNAFL